MHTLVYLEKRRAHDDVTGWELAYCEPNKIIA